MKIRPMPQLTEKEIEGFWAKIVKLSDDECWLWTKYVTPFGYGQVGFRCTLYLAHRISWYISSGQDPLEKHVLHKCDNPVCCNPNHLFLGNHLDNMQDMIQKGRADHSKNPRGERNHKSKLTETQVIEIWNLHLHQGLGERILGKMFNITPQAIHYLLAGVTWKNMIPENITPTVKSRFGHARKYPEK